MSNQLIDGSSTTNHQSTQATNANKAVEADDADPREARPSNSTTTSPVSRTKRNAFETLMSSISPKQGESKRSKTDLETSQQLTRSGRNGLGIYLSNPASFSSSIVLYHNAEFVVIRDKYPKSSIHLLLLPRTKRNTLHPFTAFQDTALLAATQAEVLKVKALVAEELGRIFGQFSAAEEARRDAIASGAEGELPPGRDWSKEVVVGLHAGPSMNHLHVHVLSRDRVSRYMRHRKHYNSFNTSFFVRLDELPLGKEDPRWKANRGAGLSEDLTCWRCGRDFGNKFERLKAHLAEEFELWKRE